MADDQDQDQKVSNDQSSDSADKTKNKTNHPDMTSELSNYSDGAQMGGTYNYMDMTQGSTNYNTLPNMMKEGKGDYVYADQKRPKSEYNYLDMTEGSTNYNTVPNVLKDGNYLHTPNGQSGSNDGTNTTQIEEPGMYNDLNYGDERTVDNVPNSVDVTHAGSDSKTTRTVSSTTRDPKTESKTSIDTDAGTAAAETYMDPDPEPNPLTGSLTGPDPKPEAKITSDPDPGTETPATYMDPDPDPNPGAGSPAGRDTKTGSRSYLAGPAGTYMEPEPATEACLYIDPVFESEAGKNAKMFDKKNNFKKSAAINLAAKQRADSVQQITATNEDVYQDTEVDVLAMDVCYGDIADDAPKTTTPPKLETETKTKTKIKPTLKKKKQTKPSSTKTKKLRIIRWLNESAGIPIVALTVE
ncbi:uncharacterized protein LOC142342525 isoform X2 [Convolutriloba macropyga]|uniref:uncharacterized protein LOC142342525 isoform X2 n=1 Tax=Convolutriloba macropyga TaxID=536237 RepID=UPI003F51BA45